MHDDYKYIHAKLRFLDGSSYTHRILVKKYVPMFIRKDIDTSPEYYKLIGHSRKTEAVNEETYLYDEIYVVNLE